MSELTNKPVSEVVGDSESSLIFVVYPQVGGDLCHGKSYTHKSLLKDQSSGKKVPICVDIQKVHEKWSIFCFYSKF